MTILGMDVGTQMIVLFAILLLIRVPVAFSLGAAALYAMWQQDFGLEMVGDLIVSGAGKFSLLAIPFFILAGILMGKVGMADRMIAFFRVLMGALPGGMGLVGVVVSLFWGAVSGSGPASVAAIGPMIIRGMQSDGYSKPFAAALVCTGAALSIVIPPSIGLVIYGVIAEVNIGELFLHAIIPGIIMGITMLIALLFAQKHRQLNKDTTTLNTLSPIPYADLPYLTRLWKTFISAFWGLLTPIIILGGIYRSVFTPTEAAIVAAVYAIFVGFVIYRNLSIKMLCNIFVEAARGSAVVMLVVIFAGLFGWVITVTDTVASYSEAMLQIAHSPTTILLIMTIVLLVAGMFMDAITIMFISLPIFLPVARELHWDLVWFGIYQMVALAIGLFTPPVGINLFVAANLTNLTLEKIALAALPFLFLSGIGLLVIANL